MKAVFLNTSALFGGVEKNFVVRALALQNRGHEIHVVVGSMVIYEYCRKSALKSVTLIPCSNDYNVFFFFRFFRFLSMHRPDVVFLNTKRDLWRGGLPARAVGISRIVGYWGSDYNIGNVWKINFVFSRILDRLIVNSHDLGERLLRKNFKISREKVFVVYNGFDPGLIPEEPKRLDLRTRFSIPQDAILLGSVGRLVNLKRFDLAFPMLAALRQKHNAHLVIAGTGNQLQYLQDTARKSGVEDLVHFAGEIKEIYTTTFYNEIDAFVFFSSNEGLANVLIESSYFNRFAFVLESPGMEEVIVNGVNGEICKDINSLITSLDRYIDQDSLHQTSTRSFVEDKFSVSKMVSGTESVFFE